MTHPPTLPYESLALSAVYNDDIAGLRRLIDDWKAHGHFDLNARGHYDETLLHVLATQSESRIAMARLLIANGADPTIMDCHGRTPAQMARMYRNHELEELLRQATRTTEEHGR